MVPRPLLYSHYNQNGKPVSPNISEEEAIAFIDLCNSEDVGYMHPKTTLRKATFDNLVRFVQTYNKAVVIALYDKMYVERRSILVGKQNINEVFDTLIQEIPVMLPNLECVFARKKNAQTTLLFHAFEKYLSNPHTSGCTLDFLQWMNEQPLDQLSAFVHANHVKLFNDDTTACAYIMEQFEPQPIKEPPSPVVSPVAEPKKVPPIHIETINSPRLDFRWMQHVPTFSVVFQCDSVEEATDLIQMAAHVKSKYAAAHLTD